MYKRPSRFLRALNTLTTTALTPTDIVQLDEPLRSALNHAIRNGITRVEDLAQDLDLSQNGAQKLADALVQKGLFKHIQGTTYRVILSGKSHNYEGTTGIWNKIGNIDTSKTGETQE